jgi:hypothetical protein
MSPSQIRRTYGRARNAGFALPAGGLVAIGPAARDVKKRCARWVTLR